MPVTITRRTRGGFAVAAVVALALSACSPSNGSEDPSSPSTGSSSAVANGSSAAPTSKSASPTPVPASSKGPAKNWPVPKMPEAAKEHSLKGAGAFSEYYFELIGYTTQTNNSKQLAQVSTSSCKVCNENIIEPSKQNQQAGGWNAGGEYNPTISSAQEDGPNSVWVTFQFTQEARTVFNSDGQVSEKYAATENPRAGSFTLLWDNGWKLDSVDLTAS